MPENGELRDSICSNNGVVLLLEEADAANWVYRGEGAANVVLGYAGSSPAFVGKVIRIQKSPRSTAKCTAETSTLSTHENLLWKEYIMSSTSKEISQLLFVQNVMVPLLGSEHVDPGMHVPVSRVFLEAVEKNILGQRPPWRVEGGKVNTLSDTALLISDHSIFPHGGHQETRCISIEIKPKCGFLPCSRFIAEDNDTKRCITRFQMHQVLKLHQGEISQLSDYNPLDLFSGSHNRINKAIKALFTTPQNNFRIFVNGSLVYGGLGCSADSSNFDRGGELEDMLEGIIQADHGQRLETFLLLIGETIFSSRVLAPLLEAQKLDSLDIEGAIHAYYNIMSQPCHVCGDLVDSKTLQMYQSLHSISLEESVKIVRDYLIAATAKDCSLMISFRAREHENYVSPHGKVYLESTNQSFDYKAYFIDLDMKPLKKMTHYHELDKKIIHCFKQNEMQQGPSSLCNRY
ncbi:hypothetical protein Scep_000653 [Stephania cephalantha]|uniref:Inositol-pentakisphosphate 2-kinase n=1 Tax=Stephania cephalantha TaxID=152367 RepID=A0AAP0L6G4_9MAGN